MPYQRDLAREAEVQQSRISMFETPGAANITLETLAKIAAALRVGVIVKFVPFHEMLRWENSFSPEAFNVSPRLESDEAFIHPEAIESEQLVAASTADGNNTAQSYEERNETRASNAKRPPTKELIAQGAAAGGM
jgi:transcriptional regulator with XRE-family HTH domain